jgi:ABC transporter substrate binding protein
LKGEVDALYVCTDPLVTYHQIGINTLAAGAGLPTMQAFRHHIEAGGLISYRPDFSDLFRGAADIVDKILRGAKPADIPVKQAKKCELVNMHTAKALGLNMSKGLRHPRRGDPVAAAVDYLAANTLCAVIGRRMPLSEKSPMVSTVTALSTASRTRGLIRIWPGWASSHSRDATFDTVPTAA